MEQSIKTLAKKVRKKLEEEFPNPQTPLIHKNAFELLAATMLSAQTLDATVNKVTPELFAKYSTPKALSQADVADIDAMIGIVNYHRTKSHNLVKMAVKLLQDFNGQVPNTIEKLTTLPGVGRKTANVVISEWFAKQGEVLSEGFVVDTHVIRVSSRLGLTKNKDPKKIEQDLMKLFPRETWNDMSLRIIFHGRFMCKARNPECYKHEFWRDVCSCVNEVKG